MVYKGLNTWADGAMLACDLRMTLLLLLLMIVMVELGSDCLVTYAAKFFAVEHERCCPFDATAFFCPQT